MLLTMCCFLRWTYRIHNTTGPARQSKILTIVGHASYGGGTVPTVFALCSSSSLSIISSLWVSSLSAYRNQGTMASPKRNLKSISLFGTTTRIFGGGGGGSRTDNENNNCDNSSLLLPDVSQCAVATNMEGSSNQKDPSTFVHSSVQSVLYDHIFPNLLVVDTNTRMETLPTTKTIATVTPEAATVIILLGVSGGCDSMALLHILYHLHQTQKDYCRSNPTTDSTMEYTIPQWDFHVVHFDHRQREEESYQDRIFVQSQCTQFNIPFHCYDWYDNASIPNHHKPFSQDTARQWRRTMMRQLLQEILEDKCVQQCHNTDIMKRQIGILMTAHHKDDHNETILLKLLRGVHISNVSGLPIMQRDKQSCPSNNSNSDRTKCVPIYWAKPLLSVHKTDLEQYLQQYQYTWREDASNQSNKYRRNRVRNELIPLLEDIVGGSSTLELRLRNLEIQSREIRNDLQYRAQQYLQKHTINNGRCFLLSKTHNEDGGINGCCNDTQYDLAVKEALHMWMLQQSNSECMFGYDQMQRLHRQIQDFPNRRQWRLNVGAGWDIQREGESLRMISTVRDQEDSITTSKDVVPTMELTWTFVDELQGNCKEESTNLLFIRLPANDTDTLSSYRFFTTIVGNDSHYRIQPSWRSNLNPVSMSQFLRGQGIPLHQRLDTPIVIAQDTSNATTTPLTLVAVYVSTKNEWIVDARFAVEYSDERTITTNTSTKRIALRLTQSDTIVSNDTVRDLN